jgi:sugar (pentulose or hexulose) kinase
MVINTLYQLASMARDNSAQLKAAQMYLSVPDLLNYWLCGAQSCEFTHATTTQIYNPHLKDWDRELLDTLGIPSHIFPEIVAPGTRIGEFNGIPVITPATHDTGSAVVAVPTVTENYAYLSSGTWSLLGLELPHPIINDAACEANVTNEGGVEGTFRFLKNVVGLWIAQQCRATWRAEGTIYSYDDLTAAAAEAEPFRSLIDPDHEMFLAPGDMPERIRVYCRETGQPEPETVGQVMRTVYESLALKYRVVLESLVTLADKQVDRLHIIGGGARNKLLCQMTANAIKREVVAGPYEATALGNAVIQLISLGVLDNVAQAREILSQTTETPQFAPEQANEWDAATERFLALVQHK